MANGADWIILSTTGCVMYPPERLTSFSRAGCLTTVVCGELAESAGALCGVVVPGSFDTGWNGSSTAVTAAATSALGGELAVEIGGCRTEKELQQPRPQEVPSCRALSHTSDMRRLTDGDLQGDRRT